MVNKMEIKYKGYAVNSVYYDRQKKQYEIYDNLYLIDIIPDYQIHNFPQLKKVLHGKHRQSNTQGNNHSVGKSSTRQLSGRAIIAAQRSLSKASSYGAFGGGKSIGYPFINISKAKMVKMFPPTIHGFVNGPWVIVEPPPKPIIDDGIKAGEIIGLRCWRVKGDILTSMYMDKVGWSREPMQGDPRKDDEGVHAFKNTNEVYEYYLDAEYHQLIMYKEFSMYYSTEKVPDYVPPVFAIGTIAMWGEIVEHELGYRAEYAKIKSIDKIINGNANILNILKEKYGV